MVGAVLDLGLHMREGVTDCVHREWGEGTCSTYNPWGLATPALFSP